MVVCLFVCSFVCLLLFGAFACLFVCLFFILFYFLSPQHLNLARRRAIWTKQPIELRRCDGAAVCGCDDGLEWVVDFKTAA